MSNPEEEYRHHAGSCMRLAETINDPTEKAVLLEMARAWHNLVAQGEQNSKANSVYETPPPKMEQRPLVQQQPQGQPNRQGEQADDRN